MKKILSAILAAVAVATLSSCGQGSSSTLQIKPYRTHSALTTGETFAALPTDGISAPETDTPAASSPETTAPETNVPETDAPVTDAPTTSIPETDAPHIHSYTAETTPATCTTSGKTVETCACGDTKTTVIAAMGHAWGAWETVKAPTQTETGMQRRTCTRCGATEDVILDKLPHTHSYTAETTPATCTAAGKTVETCACGDTKTTVIAAMGHTWGTWETVKEPTHTEVGTQRRTCTHCGATEDVILDKLPHTHSYTAETTPATCTTAGKTVETCACGDTKTTVIAAMGHTWGTWETVKEPTHTEVGTQRRACARCGVTEDADIEKLPMSIGEAQQEVLRLVNIERENVGLAPFSYYTAGQAAGDIRAQEIQTLFEHTRPNGTSCFTALQEVGISYYSAGENIAWGYRTPAEVVDGWMHSDGHRANILSDSFTHLIVGVNGTVGQHGVAWVQLFVGIRG